MNSWNPIGATECCPFPAEAATRAFAVPVQRAPPTAARIVVTVVGACAPRRATRRRACSAGRSSPARVCLGGFSDLAALGPWLLRRPRNSPAVLLRQAHSTIGPLGRRGRSGTYDRPFPPLASLTLPSFAGGAPRTPLHRFWRSREVPAFLAPPFFEASHRSAGQPRAMVYSDFVPGICSALVRHWGLSVHTLVALTGFALEARQPRCVSNSPFTSTSREPQSNPPTGWPSTGASTSSGDSRARGLWALRRRAALHLRAEFGVSRLGRQPDCARLLFLALHYESRVPALVIPDITRVVKDPNPALPEQGQALVPRLE